MDVEFRNALVLIGPPEVEFGTLLVFEEFLLIVFGELVDIAFFEVPFSVAFDCVNFKKSVVVKLL